MRFSSADDAVDHDARIQEIDALIRKLTRHPLLLLAFGVGFIIILTTSTAITQTEKVFDFKSVWASVLYHWAVPTALCILVVLCSPCVVRFLYTQRHTLEHQIREEHASTVRVHGDDLFAKQQGAAADVYTPRKANLSARSYTQGGFSYRMQQPTAATPSTASHRRIGLQIQ